jgi:hypothetical protein
MLKDTGDGVIADRSRLNRVEEHTALRLDTDITIQSAT